jgi:hypothetical protein
MNLKTFPREEDLAEMRHVQLPSPCSIFDSKIGIP